MVLINGNYTRLWIGQTISLIGDFAFGTALLLWISIDLLDDVAAAPAVTTALLMMGALVTIAVAPVAGVLVDRWDPRRTMLRADLASAATAGALTVVAFVPAGALPIPALLLAVAVADLLTTTIAQFFSLSRMVLIYQVVPSEQRGRASGYAQTTAAVAALAGPALAAPLVVSAGVRWVMLINAVSFLASYLAIRSVRPDTPREVSDKRPAERSMRREFLDGLRFTTGNRIVRVVLVAAVLATLGTGALNALEVYFVQEDLHASAAWFGLLSAAFGAGTMVGSFVGGVLGDRFNRRRVFALSMLAFGALYVVYSQLSSIGPALVVSLLFGVALGVENTVAFPLLLDVVPSRYLGRVMAVFNPANQAASMISMGVAGVLASTVLADLDNEIAGWHLTRIGVILLGSALLVVGGGVYALVALRTSEPDRQEPAAAVLAIPATATPGDTDNGVAVPAEHRSAEER